MVRKIVGREQKCSQYFLNGVLSSRTLLEHGQRELTQRRELRVERGVRLGEEPGHALRHVADLRDIFGMDADDRLALLFVRRCHAQTELGDRPRRIGRALGRGEADRLPGKERPSHVRESG